MQPTSAKGAPADVINQRVAVTGAGGFVGRAVVAELTRRGHMPIALSRNPDALDFGPEVERRRFDPSAGASNLGAFEDADAVIHLAGESVAGRWTSAKKHAILASRVDGTRAVVAALSACKARPATLISASASGYYGSRGDEALFESAPPGNDFLARVCTAWEREAAKAEGLGIRCVRLRTGIVLGWGGALAQMATPFRFGVGGPLGSGRQFVPWIHLEDLAALYVFCVEHPQVSGAVNGVAPDYATNARFAGAIGAALGRPALIPAPGPALRLVLGEFAQSVLESQLMIPAVAEDAGFAWRFTLLEEAVHDALKRSAPHASFVRTFKSETFLPYPLASVFPFFSDARNLETITPPSLRFAIRTIPASLERGAQIEYGLRIHGLPIHWKTMIASWEPPHRFVDVQLHGPYALWRHTHAFVEMDGGVMMHDRVEYVMPFYPLGGLATPLVESDVRSIFAFRTSAIAGRLGPAETHVAAT